jgi:hypothetical protein
LTPSNYGLRVSSILINIGSSIENRTSFTSFPALSQRAERAVKLANPRSLVVSTKSSLYALAMSNSKKFWKKGDNTLFSAVAVDWAKFSMALQI